MSTQPLSNPLLSIYPDLESIYHAGQLEGQSLKASKPTQGWGRSVKILQKDSSKVDRIIKITAIFALAVTAVLFIIFQGALPLSVPIAAAAGWGTSSWILRSGPIV